MSDQLRIPQTPMPHDNIPRPDNGSSHIIDTSDTSKVIKTNVKDEYNQNQSGTGNEFNTQSIRAKTLRLLLSSETATEAAKRLLLNKESLALSSGNSADGLKWAAFMDKFFLSPGELSAYLKDQLSNTSLFQGSFFDFLRGILDKYGQNAAIKGSVMDVLKSMELYQNRQNTAVLLIHNLNNLLPFLSERNQQNILSALNQLQQNLLSGGDILSADLQKSIMQVLSETGSQSKDQAALRNMIMQAVHNLSRLDCSDEKNLLKTIDNFSGTLEQYSKLTAAQKETLMNALQHQLQDKSANHSAADRILSALDYGLSSNSPLSMQLASSNILSALLLNHSVLLPLIYGFIPLQLDNSYLFSELWAHIKEEDDEEESSSKKTAGGKSVEVFFTMESSAFGYIQGTLESRSKALDIQLEVPSVAVKPLEGLSAYLEPITSGLGFTLSQLQVVPLEEPKRFVDVFGKKILKEASLNVRV